MRFSPLLRQAKYEGVLRDGVSGITAEVLLGEQEVDAMRVSLSDEASLVSGARTQLFLHARVRGWYVTLLGMYRFRLLDKDLPWIDGIVLEVLHRLRELRANSDVLTVIQGLPLVPVMPADWCDEERAEMRDQWRSYGWLQLLPDEEDNVWDRFTEKFVDSRGKLSLPAPCRAVRFASGASRGSDAARVAENRKVSLLYDILQLAVPDDDFVFALDYDHPCCRFFPRRAVREAYRDYWAIDPTPFGGSVYFISSDMESGVVLNHNRRMILFGTGLADSAGIGRLLDRIG